jgi:hypothetical protein
MMAGKTYNVGVIGYGYVSTVSNLPENTDDLPECPRKYSISLSFK